MTAWVRRWSIATRLFVVQVGFIAVLTTAATIWLWADARADVEADAAAKTMAVATSIADNPFVVEALATDDPTAELQPYAVDVMADTDTDFVTIMNPDRTRYTHPDVSQIGLPFQGTIEPALRGEPFTETYTGTLGPSMRSTVPIEDASGEVVGIVSAGVTVSNLSAALGTRLPIVFGAALVTLLLGALVAWLLSRYLRRVTWGRGPEEMSRMFAYYEGVLHSVREGLLLVDTQGRLVLANDQATELLGLPRHPSSDASGEPVAVRDLELPASLRDLLAGGAVAVDEVHLTDDRVLVVNQAVAVSTPSAANPGPARILGTVTTVRDRTELEQLAGELATMRTLSDALRSQTHEFANRLHTIVALIELGRPEQALAFAAHELDTRQELADEVMGAVEEPVLAALLFGKAAQASERGVELAISVDDAIADTDVPPAEWVTIVGNLIDNAVDAVAATMEPAVSVADPTVEVAIDVVTEGTSAGGGGDADAFSRAVRVRVSDNGPGVVDPERVFQRGFSTKEHGEAGRGLGLALVGQSVRRLGGTVAVTPREGGVGAVFTVLLPQRLPTSSGRA
ncbi:Sensor histidine kinase regulating citrate/malate metabolism [Agromyces sp. CF514]|uniref:ATP-binding protein n=1 Tax=Agromyces sp. CF514 TaxID=1881031 RepID=UPI0008E58442|nr:sensor histidine kinase [Agromyces sp. CF514]SFR70242.1 Sensor histidine kinase regulating citrate/malate metabolism [Agromyces sp. CF514]